MAEFQAGEVVVPVVPDAGDFIKNLKKSLVPGAYKLGQDLGKEISRGISDNLKGVYEPLREETRKQQQRAPRDGEQVGGAFARGFKARLEAAFKSLPKAEIDADATPAQARLAELRTRMAELSDKTIGVDIDAGAALAEVGAVRAELERIGREAPTVDVRADVAAALAQLAAVEGSIAALDGRTARPRVDVDISGALSAIGTVSAALAGLAAIPVGASIGAGLLALSGPLSAAGAGFGAFGAVAIPTITRIAESLKEQETATKSASGATTSAAQAAADAASRALQLEQAEQRITDAKRAARQAEEDLTRARQDAKRAAEDLAESVRDSALAEEDAVLSVEEARERLDKVMADPEASELDRKRAELNYRQAIERLDDQQRRTKRLKEDQAEADKKGIEGSDQVKAAKERLRSANQQVSSAEAQLKVLRLQQAAAAAKESQATGTLVTKMTKLSPAAQRAAKQIKAFQAAYLTWQEKLEPAILPVVTGGLRLIQGLFKPLTPLVKGTAGALVDLEKSASKAIGGKFWTDFFKLLSNQAPRAITGLGKSLGNVVTGIAGIIKAFLPFTGAVVGGIEQATAKFAEFGKGLGKSEGFQTFLAYVRENGPKVWEIVKNLFVTVSNLLTGLSGTGSGALDLVVSITQWLSTLSPQTLQTFTLAVLGVVAAFKTWQVITTVVDGVQKSIQTASGIVQGSKKAWEIAGGAASKAKDVVKAAASGIASGVKSLGKGAGKPGLAVWTGIQTAAGRAATVAKTSGRAIATAAKTAGSATVKGASVAWDGIRVAAGRAGTAARAAGTAILTAGKTAATAAIGLGRVAFQYGRIALQAGIARARQLLYAAATGIVRVATLAWTGVQWALNAALNANPIGLIVAAIALLVGALIYAWNNSETFRTIVIGVWEGIQTAIQWAWTNVIQPVLQAIWTFIQSTLGPIFTWLWNSVIKPAWDGIAAVIKWAWDNVIYPNFLVWKYILTQVVGPAVLWLWNTIVKPAFAGIGATIKTAWTGVIKPALDALVALWKNVLGPAATWLWKTIIKPAWDGIAANIKTAWDTVIKPVFDFLVKTVTKTIPDGFKAGVDLIGKAWDLVKEVARKPVKFIVDVVYNNGIVKIWNAVADILGLKDKKLAPIAFAKGGIYPGYTPGKDIGFAAVSGGEAIMRPEWTRAVGEDYVHKMNAAARGGGVSGVARALGVVGDPGSFMGAYESGGIVGGIKDLLAGGLKAGAETFLNPLLDKVAGLMGDSRWAKLLINAPKQMVANVIKWIGENDTGSGDGGKAVAYAKAQIGKPYKWGGTGPDSFDCSGLVMRAWQSAGVADIPRVTTQQMSWVKPVTKPQPGDLGFPHEGHVWMYSSPTSKIVEAPYTGAHVREVAARAAQLMGRPPALFDSGGMLMPGTSLVHNGTGRPEPVLTDRQWQEVSNSARGGDGSLVSIGEMNVTPEQSPYAIAGELRYLLGSQVRLRR